MSIQFTDLKAQYKQCQSEILRRVENVFDHGQYIMGPEVQELEEKLANFTGANYCITVSSGTDALLISLMALGIKYGDEIITTPFTFAATVEVIVLLGAIPIFVDVELDTGNIDANLIEEKITSRTKAIIPVSIYGQTPDMDAINHIAKKNGNIAVIEDGAQSFGAFYKSKRSCNLSTIGCTSFFPSKPLGCYGDGGAIFTNDCELADAMRTIRVHGQSARYVHTRLGIGGRMDTIQCAILLAKLQLFEWELGQRAIIGERYNKLMDSEKISRIVQKDDRTSVFAQYTVIVKNREELRNELSKNGIPTAVHYPIPLNKQIAYEKYNIKDTTINAEDLASKVLSLPMGPYLKYKEQDMIVKIISNYANV